MSYDLNVVVLQQEEAVEIPFETSIKVECERNGKRYYRWQFLCSLNGMLYMLLKDELGYDDYSSAYSICDGDFENDNPEDLIPKWLPEKDRDLTPLIILEDVYEEVVSILRFLLYSSPVQMMAFHTRYQGKEREVVIGVLRFSTFLEMLKDHEILFNAVYIIISDERANIDWVGCEGSWDEIITIMSDGSVTTHSEPPSDQAD